jgi:phage gpG-like protein
MALFSMTIAEGRELTRLEGRIAVWRRQVFGELLSDLAMMGVKQIKNRFIRERRSPDGAQWLPRKDKKPHPLLNKTGEMMDSITAIRQGEAEVRVAAFSKYAMFHQHGVRMKRKKFTPKALKRRNGQRKSGPRERSAKFSGPQGWRTPPRPFMGLSTTNLREIDARINSWIGTRLR